MAIFGKPESFSNATRVGILIWEKRRIANPFIRIAILMSWYNYAEPRRGVGIENSYSLVLSV